MESSPQYIQHFSEKFDDDETLGELKAREIELHGYERNADYIMHTDIPSEDVRASQLNLFYRDGNLPGDPFNFTFDRNKVRTLCIPKLDDNDIDTVGYEFQGIINPIDAKKWYRMKWGYPADVQPPEPQIEITKELIESFGIPVPGELIVAKK